MKLFLKLLFGGIFLWMTVMTIRTSLAMSGGRSRPGTSLAAETSARPPLCFQWFAPRFLESLWQAWPTYAANPWAVATLWDACFGFLTFYVWVVYKERKIWARILWFVLIMGLGNIAMSLYVLIQLMRLGRDEPAETVLWRQAQ